MRGMRQSPVWKDERTPEKRACQVFIVVITLRVMPRATASGPFCFANCVTLESCRSKSGTITRSVMTTIKSLPTHIQPAVEADERDNLYRLILQPPGVENAQRAVLGAWPRPDDDMIPVGDRYTRTTPELLVEGQPLRQHLPLV